MIYYFKYSKCFEAYKRSDIATLNSMGHDAFIRFNTGVIMLYIRYDTTFVNGHRVVIRNRFTEL
jgi:hypothetical protein